MKLTPGRRVWIACEVKPGPFSDERIVRIAAEPTEWVGFVTARALREPVERGASFVDSVVVDVLKDTFLARLPGEGVGSSLLRLPMSRAADGGPFAS